MRGWPARVYSSRFPGVVLLVFNRYSVDRSPDLSAAGLARRHVRGFESEEISVDYMQIRVKTGAVFSAE